MQEIKHNWALMKQGDTWGPKCNFLEITLHAKHAITTGQASGNKERSRQLLIPKLAAIFLAFLLTETKSSKHQKFNCLNQLKQHKIFIAGFTQGKLKLGRQKREKCSKVSAIFS